MSYKNLGEFIARLEKEGELLRVKEKVSANLEITEITDRMSKMPGGGKALFFENVEDFAFPVLTNAFGSSRRIELAFGALPDDLAARLAGIIKQAPPRSIMEKIGMLPKALAWAKFLPRTRKMKTPPCQEVVLTGDAVDLMKLPVLFCWPEDGGRFITLPVVFTKGMEDGKRNVGMYRMQVYDGKTTGMHWHIHKDGSHHYHEYRKSGRRMEVAVAIGADPAVTYAATAPMPRGVDEMMLAGFIRQEPVIMVRGVTVDIDVPAEAEFILEGYVDPGETRIEGPFGDHTGYYSEADIYPVFHLTAITHRKNPVYSATVVGRPPMEDCYLAWTTERLFLPMLQMVMPEIKDYLLPWEGVFHSIAVISIEKEYPGHAAKIASGLWGSGQMSFAKALVIIDDASLLADGRKLLEHILKTIDFSSDITLARGILDVLDHSAENPLFGSKIAIDATTRFAGEGKRAERGDSGKGGKPSDDTTLLARLRKQNDGVMRLCTLLSVPGRILRAVAVDKEKGQPSRAYIDLLTGDEGAAGGIYVLYDAGVELADHSLLLWKAFNNVDPARDMVVGARCVVIDATRKGAVDGHERPWPDDIEMTPEIKKAVDRLTVGWTMD
jgi:4-hydroxy-3-polyprenylbenzoate decarboxylase